MEQGARLVRQTPSYVTTKKKKQEDNPFVEDDLMFSG
jgi:hypothetical protein